MDNISPLPDDESTRGADTVCRICREEATSESPVYAPCKCTGTIRHVHQACLQQWLGHSGQKRCELCGHTFLFLPVYDARMPAHVPLLVVVRGMLRHVLGFCTRWVRCILVTFVWVVVVPFLVCLWWRTVFYVMGAGPPPFSDYISPFTGSPNNSSSDIESDPAPWNRLAISVAGITFSMEYPPWPKRSSFLSLWLSNAIFEGQAVCGVAMFSALLMFFFREWIIETGNRLIQEERARIVARVAAVRRAAAEKRMKNMQLLVSQSRQLATLPIPKYPKTNELSPPTQVGAGQELENDIQPGSTGLNVVPPRAFGSSNNQPIPSTEKDFIETHELENHQTAPGAEISENEDRNAAAELENPDYMLNNINNGAHEGPNDTEQEAAVDDLAEPDLLAALQGNPPAPIARILVAHEFGMGVDDAEEDALAANVVGMVDALGYRGSPNYFFYALGLTLVFFGAFIFFGQGLPFLFGRIVLFTRVLQYLYYAPFALRFAIDQISDEIIDSIMRVPRQQQKLGFEFGSSENSFGKWVLSSHEIDGTVLWDRFVTIAIGYSLLLAVFAVHVREIRNSNPYAYISGALLRRIFHVLTVTIKTALYFATDIFFLPAFTGFILGILFLPISETTLLARMSFIVENPFHYSFFHWLFGSIYMFHLAAFVTTVRQILRPGVVWFICDPSDPRFNPFLEYAARPLLTHVRKLAINSSLYFLVCATTVGVPVLLLRLMPGFLPLRIADEVLFHIPFDLILLELVLLVIAYHLQLHTPLKRFLTAWFRVAGKLLRMTCFLFGEYSSDEVVEMRETSIVAKLSLCLFLYRLRNIKSGPYAVAGQTMNDRPHAILDGFLGQKARRDSENKIVGQLYRVPAFDHVKCVPGQKMIIPVEVYPMLIIEDRRYPGALVSNINYVIGRPGHWTFVYLPPRHSLRWIVLVFGLGLSVAVCLTAFIAVPVILGRYGSNVIRAVLNNSIKNVESIGQLWELLLTETFFHDTYAAILGIIILFAIYGTYYVLRLSVSQAKRIVVALFRWGYVMVFAGFVVPIAAAKLFYLYIQLPLNIYANHATKHASDGPENAVILAPKEIIQRDIWSQWIHALFMLRLLFQIVQIVAPNRVTRALSELNQNGWESIELRTFHRDFMLPILTGAVFCATVPRLMQGRQPLHPELRDEYLYPIFLAFVITILVLLKIVKLLRRWLDSIKDEEYLVDKVLIDFPEAERNQQRVSYLDKS